MFYLSQAGNFVSNYQTMNKYTKKKLTLILLIVIISLPTSCKKEVQFLPDIDVPGKGVFIDYGFIPADVKAGLHVAEFQSMVYHNNQVFVATSNGIWKVDLTSRRWSRAGLDNKLITVLYQHPEKNNTLFAGIKPEYGSGEKTLYISENGGKRWKLADSPIFDSYANRYEVYACMAVRPEYPNHIYANLEGGTTIAVSTDGGNNWVRMNQMDYSNMGYQSAIAFLPGKPDMLFQGSESPLDYAWLGSYEIDPSDPGRLHSFKTIVDITQWSNRRPCQLKTFAHTPGILYVGQEGALSVIEDGESRYVYVKNDHEYDYTYVYGIWVNPDKPDHIIFGGGLSHNLQPMQLYETTNDGELFQHQHKIGMENPVVADIIQAGKHPAILFNDLNANRVKLVIYEPF